MSIASPVPQAEPFLGRLMILTLSTSGARLPLTLCFASRPGSLTTASFASVPAAVLMLPPLGARASEAMALPPGALSSARPRNPSVQSPPQRERVDPVQAARRSPLSIVNAKVGIPDTTTGSVNLTPSLMHSPAPQLSAFPG